MIDELTRADYFDVTTLIMPSTACAAPFDLSINELKLIKGDYQGCKFPVRFQQKSGKNLYDILDTGHPGLFLISERMRRILQDHGLTGWAVFAIQLADKLGNEIQGYYGFSATGRSGPINYEYSTIIVKRLVPNGPEGQYYKGLFFDRWDGTDFFTPDFTYQTFVTQRAAEILIKNKITNMHLEKLSEVEVHVNDVRKYI